MKGSILSLPISPSAVASGAAKIVQSLAGQVSHVTGFDQVLQDAGVVSKDVEPVETESLDAESLTGTLTEAIRQHLARWAGETNPVLEVSVTNGGLQINGNHPRAAEFEALLSQDPEIGVLAQQLYLSLIHI